MNEDEDDIMPEGVDLRDPMDFTKLRQSVFDDTKSALESSFPVSYGGVRLELGDVHYAKEKDFDPEEQTHALLHNRHLARKLVGTMRLYDDTTGDLLEERAKLPLMQVPWLSDRGTIVHNGSDYTVASQIRLLPGAYTRKQENGLTETQFNVKMGTGAAMRVGFIPDKAEWRLRVTGRGSASDVHMYSFLKDMGVPDERLAEMWGSEVLAKNQAGYDPRTLDRVYKKLVLPRLQVPDAPVEEKTRAIQESLQRARVHKKVLERTLPNFFDPLLAERWKLQGMAKSAAAADAPGGLQTYLNLRKHAAFMHEDLTALILLLNERLQAGLPTTGTREQLEAAVMDFVMQESAPQGSAAVGANLPGAAQLTELGEALGSDNSAEELLKTAGELPALLQAKEHSDKKRYAAKHAILAGLLLSKPDEFVADSREGDMVGLTHAPTNFRIHVPAKFVPASVMLREGQIKSAQHVLAVDLDGTLAQSHDGEFNPDEVGEPVPAVLRRVKRALRDGHEVRIFTARAHDPKNVAVVRAWAQKHGLPEDTVVTNVKTPDVTEIWDDRAVAVEDGEAVLRPFGSLMKDAAVVRTFGDRWFVMSRDGSQMLGVTTSPGYAYDLVDSSQHALVKMARELHPVELKKRVKQARKDTAKPTSTAQADAGNYSKGEIPWKGLTLTLENPKGSTRSGVSRTGKRWSVRMLHDYGYINGTSGADGDHLDVFIGPDPDADLVVVINQNIDGRFDEHKCMLGYKSTLAAIKAYHSNYDASWKGYDSSCVMTSDQFKKWLKNGDQTRKCIATWNH